jgi:hypothetical protein
MNWRIKTEREFIQDYGESWRNKLRSPSWVADMDYLFGKPLSDEDATKIHKEETGYRKSWFSFLTSGPTVWTIGTKMIIIDGPYPTDDAVYPTESPTPSKPTALKTAPAVKITLLGDQEFITVNQFN